MKLAIRNVLINLLNIKPLENVLVLTDTKMEKIGRMFYDASKSINLETALMVMEARTRDGEELPLHVSKAMRSSNVVIAPTYYSITYTKAVKNACLAGARIASLPRISEFSIKKGGLTADYKKVREDVEKMFNAVDGSNFVEVTSKNGTAIYFSVRERKWFKDYGEIKEGSFGNLPAGDVFIAPVEKSVNGKIVFDSFEFSTSKKTELTIEDGRIVEMKGVNKQLKEFLENHPKAKVIGEFGIGSNYKAKVIGNALEDEKAKGTVHFDIGSNVNIGGLIDVPLHVGGVIKKPTVKVDNRIIIENGVWQI
ncbi:MAG: leucyl aminopeptidase [Candidatus Aenigmarchaeota archaeon ex4484_224]|nr:MAG: leucyl aminopeptidase [Candidatus Aenigmarchaeota archaeon ex4484_224]